MGWGKGESGNPGGRPPGAKGKVKAITDDQIAEKLSEGSTDALQTIKDLFKSKSEGMQLKSALAWLSFDKSMRDFVYKKVTDELKVKPTESPEGQSKPKAPVRSLKSVMNKK